MNNPQKITCMAAELEPEGYRELYTPVMSTRKPVRASESRSCHDILFNICVLLLRFSSGQRRGHQAAKQGDQRAE